MCAGRLWMRVQRSQHVACLLHSRQLPGLPAPWRPADRLASCSCSNVPSQPGCVLQAAPGMLPGQSFTLAAGSANASYAPADWRTAAREQFPGRVQRGAVRTALAAAAQRVAAGAASLASWGLLPQWAAQRISTALLPGASPARACRQMCRVPSRRKPCKPSPGEGPTLHAATIWQLLGCAKPVERHHLQQG